MSLPASTVARKLLMAATGQLMIIFIILHVLGNSTIFYRTLNAYAAGLHALPLLLWIFRSVMLAAIMLHVFYGIQVTIENREAKPRTYAVQEYAASTFSSRNMIWTGTAIGSFLIYHLLHFTFQTIDPSTAAVTHPDAAGRPDVFAMVFAAFRRIGILLVYAAGLLAVWLHLSHGIQSSFQTWGLNGEKSFPYIKKGSRLAALILLLAYAAIPAAIVMGLLK
ncbi:MAG: succinate dehydrogenase cytochrome b subunit [Nitrospirota bacterium]|nr:succinate dehydrogenase cytochrome b subunit [Nitrospirota bacterium]